MTGISRTGDAISRIMPAPIPTMTAVTRRRANHRAFLRSTPADGFTAMEAATPRAMAPPAGSPKAIFVGVSPLAAEISAITSGRPGRSSPASRTGGPGAGSPSSPRAATTFARHRTCGVSLPIGTVLPRFAYTAMKAAPTVTKEISVPAYAVHLIGVGTAGEAIDEFAGITCVASCILVGTLPVFAERRMRGFFHPNRGPSTPAGYSGRAVAVTIVLTLQVGRTTNRRRSGLCPRGG